MPNKMPEYHRKIIEQANEMGYFPTPKQAQEISIMSAGLYILKQQQAWLAAHGGDLLGCVRYCDHNNIDESLMKQCDKEVIEAFFGCTLHICR